MLYFNLNPIFKARGIEYPYTFLVKSGLTPNSATRILNSQFRTLHLGHVEKICEKLNCTPNDILCWAPKDGSTLSENHPLTKLKKTEVNFQLKEILNTMPLNELNEIAAIISKNKKQ